HVRPPSVSGAPGPGGSFTAPPTSFPSPFSQPRAPSTAGVPAVPAFSFGSPSQHGAALFNFSAFTPSAPSTAGGLAAPFSFCSPILAGSTATSSQFSFGSSSSIAPKEGLGQRL